MTTELWMLLGGIVLGLVHLFAGAQASAKQRGFAYAAGNRDTPTAPLAGTGGRIDRAFRNFQETFPLFVAAILMAHVVGSHNSATLYGSILYLVGRALYLPVYVAGIVYIRTLVWGVATIGIIMVTYGIVSP